MNFQGGKNQFFPPVTSADFRAGNACTDNTLTSLVGIRGKNLFGGNFRAGYACTGS